MALLSCSLRRERVSVDEEADRLLNHDLIKVTARGKAEILTNICQVYIVLLHIILLALGLSLWKFASHGTNLNIAEKASWSPVQEFIEYELRDLSSHKERESFGGAPTEEQDDVWDYLINGAFFNASLDELSRAGESLDDLAELTEGGFLASIGVYHELHCLRQIRLYVYKDLYYPKINRTENHYVQKHVDHCLEALRQTVMCYGNTALSSFYWPTPHSLIPEPRSNARSVCARWDTIESWAYSRRVSVNPDYNRSLGD
ncbi:hypothetical protein GGR58DRAFT_490579 [Xylaria digitata]|nr:hypothetical protein GGR58DRAFT_490579 [Xylaria digitata]